MTFQQERLGKGVVPIAQAAVTSCFLSFNFISAIVTIVANKTALKLFPFPATLTAVHYISSLAVCVVLHVAGIFPTGSVQPAQRKLFASLVVAWAVCNALSNASLGANSVGFYQLMKVLTTPIIVVIDYLWHSKRVSSGKAMLLALACAGIAVATVSDVQLNLRGTCLALASISTGIIQKVLNEHLQQRGGLSTIQLMHLAFPWMTLIGICLAPLLDPVQDLLSVDFTYELMVPLVTSAMAAVCINFSTTLVLGATSALSLVLLGQLKTCAVLLAGVMLFDAKPNLQAELGAATAILCIGWYAVLKVLDKQPKPAEKQTSQPLLPRPEELRQDEPVESARSPHHSGRSPHSAGARRSSKENPV